ncbi:hypothetical protein JCM11641_006780 [Rhodosporidiobolus odoratus]
MANAFVGLPVLIKLRSNPHDSVQGVLSALDPTAGTLTLSEARVHVGGTTRLEGLKILRREDVAGLELLSVERGQAAAQPPQVTQQDGIRRTQPQQPVTNYPQPRQHHSQHASHPHPQEVRQYIPAPQPTPSPISSSPVPPSGKARRSRGARGGNRVRHNGYGGSEDVEGGEEADLSTAYVEDDSYTRRRQQVARQGQQSSFDEDFDFSAGLQSFDKARVFDEIRSNDPTDPSRRLVAHNRNPRSMTPQSKLLPSENVLSASELHDQQDERSAALAARSAGESGQGTPEGGLGEGETREVTQSMRNVKLDGQGRARLVTKKGVVVPTIRAKQWKEALSIADIESSPTPLQRLEATAHALLAYILQHSLIPLPSPASRPTVLLLVSDCAKGRAALRAATLLAHRGVKVAVLVEEGVAGGEDYRTGLRVLSGAGGRVINDLTDLASTYDLILEALSYPLSSTSSLPPSLSASTSSQYLPLSPQVSSSPSSSSNFASQAVIWANTIDRATRLSIEVPWGLESDSGSTLSDSSPAFSPTHLLSLSLPRPCIIPLLLSSSSSSPPVPGLKVALADLGFSPILWERVGVEGEVHRGVWGVEGVVELVVEYL